MLVFILIFLLASFMHVSCEGEPNINEFKSTDDLAKSYLTAMEQYRLVLLSINTTIFLVFVVIILSFFLASERTLCNIPNIQIGKKTEARVHYAPEPKQLRTI